MAFKVYASTRTEVVADVYQTADQTLREVENLRRNSAQNVVVFDGTGEPVRYSDLIRLAAAEALHAKNLSGPDHA